MSADSARRPPPPPTGWASRALEQGRAAWPGLLASEEELARVAALRDPGAAGHALARLDPAELYIVAACVRGDGAALQHFRARYFDPVVPALRRTGLPEGLHDDLWQQLCERLFLSPGGDESPRIVRYAGAGELAGLVRVSATRLALTWLKRDRPRSDGDEWLRGLQVEAVDPELKVMKAEHRADLKAALEGAVAGLDARERMVLRLHLVERLGVDAIAALCSVHRATAARTVARAKERLAARVRDHLVARWHVADDSLPALRALVDDEIELSLERLLAAD